MLKYLRILVIVMGVVSLVFCFFVWFWPLVIFCWFAGLGFFGFLWGWGSG